MTAPDPPLPRLVPGVPLPRYAFVPGRTPHPRSDPAGHSYGHSGPPPEPLEPERWSDSVAYLYGFDLFNAGFYWEAHESWEGLWLAAGRRGAIADTLKALIQLAAAGVKHRESVAAGVVTHARRAAELWRIVADETGQTRFLGLNLTALAATAGAIADKGWPEPAPAIIPS